MLKFCGFTAFFYKYITVESAATSRKKVRTRNKQVKEAKSIFYVVEFLKRIILHAMIRSISCAFTGAPKGNVTIHCTCEKEKVS